MKRLLVAIIMSLIWVAPGSADDPNYGRASSLYNWTGCYFGGHIGGGWQSTSFQDPSATINITLCCNLIGSMAPGGSASDATSSGFLGGLQAGWHYQSGHMVIGGEMDFSWANLKASTASVIPSATPLTFSATETFGTTTNWTATFAPMIGFAQDKWMFYSKGGVAIAQENYNLAVSGVNQGFGPAGFFSFQSSKNETRVGGMLGAGVRWAVSDHWSLNAEYDFLYFPTKSVDFTGVIQNPGGGFTITNPSTFNTNNSQDISQVKVGASYRF